MIKALYLRNFRNYDETTVLFHPKVNVIFGENAQGKSNLLEAISLLLTGRSFRTPHLNDLIRFDTDAFYLEALFEKNGVEQTLKFSFNREGRKITHNFTLLPNLSSLLGILQGVILAPEDYNLMKGGPQARRQFIDLFIAQSNPLYLFHLSRYSRSMKQRNILLKKKVLDTIEVWEEQMAISAAFLTRKRAALIQDLNSMIQHETLASDKLSLTYLTSPPIQTFDHEYLITHFCNQFKKNRRREVELGTTLCGPHRDDLTVMVHHKEAKKFASEGQQRSCIASLKLTQWRWLREQLEMQPILCIDDLGVSFDLKRENELLTRIDSLGQVFITSTKKRNDHTHLIHVKRGNIIS